MRTVAQHRDLAALVKRVHSIHSYLLEPVSDEEARGALGKVANALGIKLWQQWSADELVTVLIAELPNLEHLSILTLEPIRLYFVVVMRFAGR
ncbi:hypothetical protein FQN54_004886 [Arachnomyces sp. PD_36]|nr:hypothetical protein FQN54_004886 [Arachnomyces sp. PD_36]